jgi:2-keto-4-pentenoate hydratase/2-oxohepta-3-ene-1,7-dioic acid hydratase in catechol pathway
MRIAVINQRLSLIQGGGAVDVQAASGGRFGPDAATAYECWAEFTDWTASADLPEPEPFTPAHLGSPSPAPRQVFGIGLNYAPGDVLTSHIQGIGEMSHRFVAGQGRL